MSEATKRKPTNMTNPTAAAVKKNKRKRSSSPTVTTSRKVSNCTSSSGKRSTNSDAPSQSSTNSNGFRELNKRIRSVFYDPIGLPLVCAFHKEDVRTDVLTEDGKQLLELCREKTTESKLPKDSKETPKDSKESKYNEILRDAVHGWRANGVQRKEPHLTARIATGIGEVGGWKAEKEKQVKDKNGSGKVDVLVTSADATTSTTPYLLMEVGLKGVDWLKKLDQSIKYLEKMSIQNQHKSTDDTEVSEKLLLAVLTIDGLNESEEEKDKCLMRLGVFLCVPSKATTTSRMCLLWKSQTTTLKAGSDAFGKLIRITKGFQTWRDGKTKTRTRTLNPDVGYEYYSSNCCRVGKSVRWLVGVCLWLIVVPWFVVSCTCFVCVP